MSGKSRVLHIQKYLERYTDEDHPASLSNIIDYLKECGLTANRKTIAADIADLIDAGIDVVCGRSRSNQYFIGDRHFELPELKLLVDAVQASRFISSRKSKQLINKLTSLASIYQEESLRRHLYVEKQLKTKNEGIYRTVDLLNAAINIGKQLQFKYYEYTVEKKKVYKHGGQIYQFSPYGLLWNNDSYYAVGYSADHGKVVKFRVDRIAVPKLTTIPAVKRPAGFDIAEYAKSVFQMFDGTLREVTLRCDNSMMTIIIDRFGENVVTEVMDDDHFSARVHVSVSPTFFGWIFSFSGRITIIEPEDVMNSFFETIEMVAEKSR